MNKKNAIAVIISILFFATTISTTFGQTKQNLNTNSLDEISIYLSQDPNIKNEIQKQIVEFKSTKAFQLMQLVLAYQRGEIELTESDRARIKQEAFAELEGIFIKLTEFEDSYRQYNAQYNFEKYLSQDAKNFVDTAFTISKSDLSTQEKMETLIKISANCGSYLGTGISFVLGAFALAIVSAFVSFISTGLSLIIQLASGIFSAIGSFSLFAAMLCYLGII